MHLALIPYILYNAAYREVLLKLYLSKVSIKRQETGIGKQAPNINAADLDGMGTTEKTIERAALSVRFFY